MPELAPAALPRSLHDRLGGGPAIAAVVERLYVRILADPQLAPFFATTDMAWLTRRQAQFLVEATGGPAGYAGRSMRAAHGGLSIESRHFDRAAAHLDAALADLDVPRPLAQDVLALITSLRSEVIADPKHVASRPSKRKENDQ